MSRIVAARLRAGWLGDSLKRWHWLSPPNRNNSNAPKLLCVVIKVGELLAIFELIGIFSYLGSFILLVAAAICLIIGLVIGIWRRQVGFLWLLMPLLLSLGLFEVANSLSGQVSQSVSAGIFLAVMAIQIGAFIYLVGQLKETQGPAALVSFSGIVFAWYSNFLSMMLLHFG